MPEFGGGPFDYGSALAIGQSLVPDYLTEISRKVGIDAQKSQMAFQQAQIGAAAQKQQRQAQYQAAMQAYLANPSANGLAALLGQFPEYGDESKAAFTALDGDRQKTELTQMGEIAALASGGNWKGAANALRARVEADKAAGHVDPMDVRVLENLESGDPARQKEALGLLTYGLGVAVGPEHAKSFLESQGLSLEPNLTVVSPGSEVIDQNNPGSGAVYSSPYRPQTITDPASGQTLMLVPKGAAAAVPANVGPAQTAVAATLAGGGMPAPVVAGFLGNFHVEGGYGGASGDGGTSHGIMQLHSPERIANFQRVIGKPVTEAGPDEQARFVLWEMQHPEQAGMTIGQRDAILRAKTAPEAAELIDRFYERSSGEHREKRKAAASMFVTTAPPKVRSIQEAMKLPKGTRFIDPNGVERIR